MELEPERDLLARCVARQPGAWSDFVDRYASLVYHLVEHSAHARGVVLNESRKRDLCEDVFGWLLKDNMAALREFEWRSHFITWLAVMGRRRVVHRMIERAAAEKLGHVPADAAASAVQADDRPEAPEEEVEDAVLIEPGPSGAEPESDEDQPSASDAAGPKTDVAEPPDAPAPPPST